ncbi:hypothetical protein [Cohnella sp. WQ 127256]|uniref:hypothetical protein n=1 Tax=Cohnella sp. WQ 127256 TaxID=2938790 RepID=UPI0021184031|nr:hypothetical protein [Cohnella sp. WQ 127256]
MKRISTLPFIIILIVICLIGCTNGVDTILDEVKQQKLNKDVQTFINNTQDSNGLYLYSPVNENQFIIVKYSNVLQGEEAKFLNSITGKLTDKTMMINIEELGTHNYHDKRLKDIRIFKLGSAQDYEKIQIFKNGEEINFELVSG